MNNLKLIPNTIVLFVKIYFVVLSIFSLFRLILLTTEFSRISNINGKADVFYSFVIGLRFDIVISSYILFLPFFVITISSFFKRKILIEKIVEYYIIVLFSITFLVSAVDIPYFHQFFSRFSISAFLWTDSPIFMIKMIFQEPRYWIIIIPYVILIFILFKVVRKIFLAFSIKNPENKLFKVIFSVVFLLLIFVGIRGRIEEKSPIRIGTAYFSNNAFLNKLGLNPNFTLIRSYLDSRKEQNKQINLINDSVAVSNVQRYFKIDKPDSNYPLLRKIDFDNSEVENANVILVIMESMSAQKMKRHGNTNNLTPFLDSISNSGYYFENTYTSGIHTMNGIFSSLFGHPALFRRHPMKGSSMVIYNNNIFTTLKENNYSTIYFTTHDGQFDNVEGFLKANNCERVVSKPDYPSEQIKTTLGVPDDYMFEFSIPILNKLNEKQKPFFATFMTASDHGPYYIPEYFNARSTEIKNQIVEYADYSLQKFINLATKQKWFRNTIFVFIADHGAPIDNLYDMSLAYNHTPLIFYAPGIITKPQIFSTVAGQIDIFPTIMGLLKIPYNNNTLGIDLLREIRPYIYFNADDKYGVIDNEWFLIVRNDGSKSLYKYKDFDKQNYADDNIDIVEKMNLYAKSNLQTFQYIFRTNKQ